MKHALVFCLALATAGSALAAPNVTNGTQKGSLLIFPDIRVDDFNTLIRIENDGSTDVDVKCYWMDGNKNRVDFIIPITKNQPVWFDAKSGRGTHQVNPFPRTASNGIDNPFLPGPAGPYDKGLLACWAVDAGSQNQVKWNHLSATATVYGDDGAYQYNAYAFFVPTGLDLQPVGVPGTLNLNGVDYDSCPLYQIAQFTPDTDGDGGPLPGPNPFPFEVGENRFAIAGCTLNLQQDWTPVWTKLQFEVWNADEIKFTGAYTCADSWHEVLFDGPFVDSAAQNFFISTLGTFSARMRVQGVKSTQCEGKHGDFTVTTQAVGLIAVHATELENGVDDLVGTTLANAGKFTGKIVWDPEGAVPEGQIR